MTQPDELTDWVTVYEGTAADAGALQAELGYLGVQGVIDLPADESETTTARLRVSAETHSKAGEAIGELVAKRLTEGLWKTDTQRDEAEALGLRIRSQFVSVLFAPIALASAPRYLRLARGLTPRPHGHGMTLFAIACPAVVVAVVVLALAASLAA